MLASESLNTWRASRATKLDELENAHRAVGGRGRGRRYATQQLNQAYAVLLSSQFQGFCRDLHTEVSEYLVLAVEVEPLHAALRAAFTWNRALDRGNPNPGALGTDFNRYGITFWDSVHAVDHRNVRRHQRLEELNRWRNAIAHQDFDAEALGGATTLTLRTVRGWRSACNGLAMSFDTVMRAHLRRLIGTIPW